MVAGHFFLQILDVIPPVSLRAAHIAVPGHVLHLPKVVTLQPVDDHALAYLPGITKIRVLLLQLSEQVTYRAFNLFRPVHAQQQLIRLAHPGDVLLQQGHL